jgi:hypothetical protein
MVLIYASSPQNIQFRNNGVAGRAHETIQLRLGRPV